MAAPLSDAEIQELRALLVERRRRVRTPPRTMWEAIRRVVAEVAETRGP